MKKNITLAITAGFILICIYTYFAMENAPENVVESWQNSSFASSRSSSNSSVGVEMP